MASVKKAKKITANAVGVFTKIRDDLLAANGILIVEADRKEEQAKKLVDEVTELDATVAANNEVIVKLGEFIPQP